MPFTKVVLVVDYDGTNYCGFQLQREQPTIQGEIEKALQKLTGDKTRVLAASRTDAGVHARGQVVSFRTTSALPSGTLLRALNFHLPVDIVVTAAHKVNDSFDVRRQAISREYRYWILNGGTRSPFWQRFSHLVPGELNVGAMNEACRLLYGEHDFASFASRIDISIRNTRRTVYRAEMARDREFIIFDMVAKSFLPHQVRNTVGALIRVGRGKMTSDQFNSIIKVGRRGTAGPAAPARGLCLMKVNYPRPFEEEHDEDL